MTDQSVETEARAPTVWGTFQARDARKMLDFLCQLGFEATAVYADPDDPSIIRHAQLDWPEGGGIMFGNNQNEEWSLQPGSAGFYVVTDDPRAVHAKAVQAGADITREPSEKGYGSVEFALRDPEGNQWSFGSYRGEPRADASGDSA